MRIASVTLAGPGTEGIIGDALRSVVDEVDTCLVIDTDPERGNMRDLGWVPATPLTMAIPWREDFAFMRNKALDVAAKLGTDWAIWLDTDERLTFAPNWRDALNTPASAVTAWHVSGEYAKERFIRLPRQGKYVGPTHEYFAPKKGRTMTETRLVTFDELPRDKDAPAWREKLERDKAALRAYASLHKDEARWWYYLGDTLHLLGENPRAAWDNALKAAGPSEIQGWAAFRAAAKDLTDGFPVSAQQTAMLGFTKCPFAVELFWVTAAALFDQGRYEEAIEVAMHAGVAGKHNGWGKNRAGCSGFVYPPALYEGPFDVLSLAYERLGRLDMALAARKEYTSAKAAREATQPAATDS